MQVSNDSYTDAEGHIGASDKALKHSINYFFLEKEGTSFLTGCTCTTNSRIFLLNRIYWRLRDKTFAVCRGDRLDRLVKKN